MTRINVVPVEELCDQHLLAEHRELIRIPKGLLNGMLSFEYGDRPFAYVIGEGHIKFFTNKLRWLYIRYLALHAECDMRGLEVLYEWPEGKFLQDRMRYWNDYRVTSSALFQNRKVLRERMPAKPRYTGNTVPLDLAA